MTRDRAVVTMERQQEVIDSVSMSFSITFSDPNPSFKVTVFFEG